MPLLRRARSAAVALLALSVPYGCSSSEDEPSGASSTAVSVPASSTTSVPASSTTSVSAGGPVRLHVPVGWFVADDGLATAAIEADLSAAIPQGPRVRAVVDAETSNPVEAFTAALTGTATVVAGPEEVVVDGRPGVAVTIRRSTAPDGAAALDAVVRFVTVTPPTGESVLFELWSPVDQWDTVASTLAAVPGLA